MKQMWIAYDPELNVLYTPHSIDALFEALRFDWEDAYSPILQENFIIHLN